MGVAERSDSQLLREHLAGDDTAFDTLTRRYADELLRFVMRYVNNTAAAEDLVQEAFVQVHLSAESFDQSRKFKPWLYTIAANKARDYLRSRGRRQTLSLDSSAVDDDGPTAADGLEAADVPATEQVAAEERKAAVRRLINEMPEHLKTILLLGYFQQLPYAEIAEILDVPVGTVKSRLHSAVAHFSRLWRERFELEG